MEENKIDKALKEIGKELSYLVEATGMKPWEIQLIRAGMEPSKDQILKISVALDRKPTELFPVYSAKHSDLYRRLFGIEKYPFDRRVEEVEAELE